MRALDLSSPPLLLLLHHDRDENRGGPHCGPSIRGMHEPLSLMPPITALLIELVNGIDELDQFGNSPPLPFTFVPQYLA